MTTSRYSAEEIESFTEAVRQDGKPFLCLFNVN